MQIIFYILFITFFFLMGIFQFFGLSITIASYAISCVVCLAIIFYFLVQRTLIINRYVLLNLTLLIWIIVSGIINQTDYFLVVNYTSFVVIPLAVYLLVRKIIDKDIKPLYSIINFSVIIQLPVLLFQYSFPSYIQYSQKLMIPIDRLFGTFPLAGDHVLSFFLIMNIIFLFVSNNRFSFFNYIIILFSVFSILLMNSAISYLLLLFVCLYFLFKKLNKFILIPVIFFFLSLLLFFVGSFDILTLLGKGSVAGIVDNASLFESGTAGRFQSVYYLFSSDLLIAGNGPGSYFNPFSDGFQVNANFSQFIWFYYDLGIIGVMILFSLILTYLKLFEISNSIKLILAVLIVVYSFFSNTLDSIVFCITLNIFAFLIQKHQKI